MQEVILVFIMLLVSTFLTILRLFDAKVLMKRYGDRTLKFVGKFEKIDMTKSENKSNSGVCQNEKTLS